MCVHFIHSLLLGLWAKSPFFFTQDLPNVSTLGISICFGMPHNIPKLLTFNSNGASVIFLTNSLGGAGEQGGGGRGEGGNTATLKTFFSAKTRKRYYRIHTSVPPNPQTHIPPGGMHVVVVGRAQVPPPWDPPPRRLNPPPYTLQPTPPPKKTTPSPPPPPPPVLTDSWGGCRIGTVGSPPPPPLGPTLPSNRGGNCMAKATPRQANNNKPSRAHQELIVTIQSPPENNSNHPQHIHLSGNATHRFGSIHCALT